MAGPGYQRIIEVIPHPYLVSSQAGHKSHIRRDGLFGLEALLDYAVLGAAKGASEHEGVKDPGVSELKEARIEILELRLRRAGRAYNASRQQRTRNRYSLYNARHRSRC